MSTKQQCSGMTKQKKRCTKNASENCKYCWQHTMTDTSNVTTNTKVITSNVITDTINVSVSSSSHIEETKEIQIVIPNDTKSLISTPKKTNVESSLILGDIPTVANIKGNIKQFDYHTDVKVKDIYATGSFELSLPIGTNESDSSGSPREHPFGSPQRRRSSRHPRSRSHTGW